MSDDQNQPVTGELLKVPQPAEVGPVKTLSANAGLTIKSMIVVPDPYSRTPGNEPMDIVELELMPPLDGNFAHWFGWADHLRFRVVRGKAQAALDALGLAAPIGK
jgi:hypothetical protein